MLRALRQIIEDDSDVSDQEDLLQVYWKLAEKPKRPKLRLENLREVEFEEMCRFERAELLELRIRLGIPETIVTASRHKWNGNDALFITLRRLAYPCRLVDLRQLFGLSCASLSQCINFILRWLYRAWKHLLGYHESRFSLEKVRGYAAATAAAGCPLKRCVGFIDGTLRPLCRPTHMQRKIFNGHKRNHGLKFQTVVTPDGIISHMAGPFNGNRHDSAVLMLSGLLERMRERLHDNNGTFCLYGDAGYPLTPHLVVPFRGARIHADEASFNLAMSRFRLSVEWGYGAVAQQFGFVDFKKNLKLWLQPVALYYTAAVLLTNCKVCFRGSATTQLFGTTPPELRDYLCK